MSTLVFRILLALIITACGIMIYMITTLSTPAPGEVTVFRKNMTDETKILSDRLVNHYKIIRRESARSMGRPEVRRAVNVADSIKTFYDSALIIIGKIRSSSHNRAQAQRHLIDYRTFIQQHKSLFKIDNQNPPDNPINPYLFDENDPFAKTYLHDQSTFIELSTIILENELAYLIYERLRSILS